MAPLRARGFTLVETLLAIAILAMVAIAVLPAFVSGVRTNTRNELRTEAVGAAQQRLEQLRLVDPITLPTGGPPDVRQVDVGSRRYEVRTHYCLNPDYCPPVSAGSRHLTVEVWFAGERIYDVETVYTQLL